MKTMQTPQHALRRASGGFTLTEVILAVVVLGVLAFSIGHAFEDSTDASKEKVKTHNAAKITERGRIATELGYHWGEDGQFPPGMDSVRHMTENVDPEYIFFVLYDPTTFQFGGIPNCFPAWANGALGLEFTSFRLDVPASYEFNPDAYQVTSWSPFTVEPIPDRPDLDP